MERIFDPLNAPHSDSSTTSSQKPSLHDRFIHRLEGLKIHNNLFDVLVAIFIGLACGAGAVGLKTLLEFFSHHFWGAHEVNISMLHGVPAWRIILIPTLGGALVGPIIHFFAREAKGHGVPEVMAAVTLKGGIIRARVAIAKSIASALTIASGGSAGREGPIIQIGAAIGSITGQFLKVNSSRLRTFVGCGAAAGIAATFNAPIAGALFSVEVILREFGVGQFGPIVISAVLATTVARLVYGDAPVFQVPHYELGSPYEFIPYILLGILCALISVGFTKLLYKTEDVFDDHVKLPEWIKPALGGLMLGILGLAVPHSFGDGMESINLALLDQFPWELLLILLVAKTLATCFTLGSGGSGGVFAPSLFLGAVSGALIGKVVLTLFPDSGIAVGGYALVAMGGVVAGTTHAPITAMLIIFEITDNYSIILPLMTVCIVSTILSQYLSNDSIYTLKLLRRGINIFQKQPKDLLKSHKVSENLITTFDSVPPTATAREILHRMVRSESTQFYVIDEDNHYQGAIHLDDVRRLLINQDGLEDILLAEDLSNDDIPCCCIDDDLSKTMLRFERHNVPELPVIKSREQKEMIGIIRHIDVLGQYNNELMRHDSPESLASSISTTSTQKTRIVEGYSMIDWDPPSHLWGKSLASSGIGQRYQVYVILCKKRGHLHGGPKPIVPNRDYVIEEGDLLVVYGSDAAIERVRYV